MAKLRVALFLLTALVLAIFGTFAIFYARGYRFDTKTMKFVPKGLLVVNSDPNGAQIFINGELKSATNATLSLAPGTYDVAVKKEGFLPWQKRLVVEKEVVTKADITLFPAAPSLTPLTFSGASNPSPSPDFTKLAYIVPPSTENKAGLWINEVVNLPIGFNREPRQIAEGDLTNATWQWSPDSREILLETRTGVFLLETNEFTSQDKMVNVASQKTKILDSWQEKRDKRLSSQLAKLPDEIEDTFKRKATEIYFSPDENKILYTASGSATIPEGIVKPLPGASTQKQVRDIKVSFKYIYDIKEDKNFEVAWPNQKAYWLPTSQHVVLPETDKIIISDYDGTNQQTVYSGSYIAPHAYSFSTGSNLIILTNLGASSSLPNLYSLNLK